MTRPLSAPPADFAPDLLFIQEQPPARLPRAVGYVTGGLFVVLAGWATFGQLDIVATAEGRLAPRNYSRVLQPAEAGIVREVLVREGESVRAGQVLLRMDATTASADLGTLQSDAALKALTLRRIDAELRGQPLRLLPQDPPALAAQVLAQYQARRQSQQDALAEQAALERAQTDWAAARQQIAKLQATLPLVQQSAASYERLVREGFVSELGANDKRREHIEKEHELRNQESAAAALASAVEQSRRKLAQIQSGYQSQLHAERLELQGQQQRTEGELRKQVFRSGLLELRAPEDGTVKDLARDLHPGHRGAARRRAVRHRARARAAARRGVGAQRRRGFCSDRAGSQGQVDGLPFPEIRSGAGTVEHVG